jgi:type IV secretory pathway VirB4 component
MKNSRLEVGHTNLQALVDRRNLLLLRETTNLEACFWSRFPTYEYLRVREYRMTSDNMAHFVTNNFTII